MTPALAAAHHSPLQHWPSHCSSSKMFTVARANSHQQRDDQGKLLVASLVESYCRMYGGSPQANHRAFFFICQVLRSAAVMPALAASLVRRDMDTPSGFHHVLRAAMQTAHDPHLFNCHARMMASLCWPEVDDAAAAAAAAAIDSPTDLPPLPLPPPRPCQQQLPPSPTHCPKRDDDEQQLFNLSVQNSRYQNDFIEIGMLGRGGFASVWRARNKLDGIEYAIKKIRLAQRNPTIFREIKHLARLEHRNIVRYYSSWLQVAPTAVREVEEEDDTSNATVPEEDDSRLIDLALLSDGTPSPDTSSLVQFEHGDSSSSRNNSSNGSSSSAPENASRASGATADTGNQEWILYIQMQLCPSTLHDYIKLRNQKCMDPLSTDLLDSERNLEIFSQILEGAACIHEQGVIHRDLKPTNIFLSMPASFHEQRKGRRRSRANSLASISSQQPLEYDTNVNNMIMPVWDEQPWVPKIGDFGLAAASFSLLADESTSCAHGHPVASSPLPPPPPSSTTRRRSFHRTRTSGVGTLTYASPEQLAKAPNAYDEKVDIYSLGIIFFEICRPFSTCMERAEAIDRLKHGILPTEFVEHYPREAALVLWMTDPDPAQRPTAVQLLECELFAGADESMDAFAILQSQLLAKSLELDKRTREVAALRQQVEYVEHARMQEMEEMTRRLAELQQQLEHAQHKGRAATYQKQP